MLQDILVILTSFDMWTYNEYPGPFGQGGEIKEACRPWRFPSPWAFCLEIPKRYLGAIPGGLGRETFEPPGIFLHKKILPQR
jgi:hypothetical protein